ncbi:MAG: threonine--tRNA ligase [Candidatus Kerfeldbacteria bacterium]|nr:threonine--tRNA ligase [Candidatus Kerfeldbacteria bacterium]
MSEHPPLYNERHSAAHLLAAAALELFPGTQLGTGPVTATGFYYDMLLPRPIVEADLGKLETIMCRLMTEGHQFMCQPVTAQAATQFFHDQPFKQELVDKFAQQQRALTLYKTGSFTDLCEGGHVVNTSQLDPKAFRLTKLAGAYWQADETRPQLTRIYGVLFQSEVDLKNYFEQQAQAELRDHRKLGKELDLFIFSELIGPGLPVYTPKGAKLRRLIQELSREQRELIGYEEVHTPNINKAELFKISGHYDKYKNDMLAVHSNYSTEEYFLKPMNCPQHTQVFAAQLRSYKDLPLRLADFANLYRDEKPGELSGLTRLRAFSQDDAHCFCREDQITEEFSRVLKAIETELTIYGMEYYVRLSIWDPAHKEKFLGDETVWDKAQTLLQGLLDDRKLNYVIGEGEAAFYGPKMDFIAKDSLGREWQISTIQIDFNMPQRFGLEYITADGSSQTPVMIHSALVGSPERFLAILIEHYGGNFPTWLAPVHVSLLAVSEKHNQYCLQLAEQFKVAGLRVTVNTDNETVGNKIRKATKDKTPYLVVIGDKEIESQQLALRKRGSKDTTTITLADFIGYVQTKIQQRDLTV